MEIDEEMGEEIDERVALTRQALYRFYAGLLLYPEAERLQTLRSGAAWLAATFEDEDLARALGITSQLRDLVMSVQAFDGDLQEYQGEWVRLFGASRDGYCFPYEGSYRGAQAAGPLLAELQKEYARAGLAMSISELPDHVSVELEYLSYLCGLELETLHSGDDVRRGRIVKAQYLFLDNHLCQWLPILCERVSAANGGHFATICGSAADTAAGNRRFLASKAAEQQQ